MNLPRAVMMLLLLLPVQPLVQAAEVLVAFDSAEHERMYHELLREYRCLKCQNQNLADSNASLAGDLRREIRLQILDGKTRQDIDDYLVSRYGEFVLYRPRFTGKTAILWLGPFALLIVGLGSIVALSRRRSENRREESGVASGRSTESDDYAARLEKARRLLKN
ncbi:MAG: cytochrome c-type biogenesis protein CcmH [Granulosicoccus sp.]|nr:cytochrome c-type biogenesis protein CcmH [Granulosicoccus sp.]